MELKNDVTGLGWDEAKQKYLHSSLRNVIECSFGVLK
jgi:hypothetical protein